MSILTESEGKAIVYTKIKKENHTIDIPMDILEDE
jgi:hypothetical protein